VNLHCLHPKPPWIGDDVEERDAELLLVAREAARDRRPTIICGDLNDVAWSHTTRLFQRTSGLLDPRVGRGLYATFHAKYWFARWPLDHIFHDASFTLGRLQVLGYFGSDHFPVFARLVHKPSAKKVQEAPSPEPGDQREASKKIAEGLQND
jgi:endonuclease/exonuclease/phosphatase (EEP) superfamily protein YafD